MWVLVAAILGSAIAFIDGSAVNVALPVVGRELRASAADLQWVIEGYTLTLSAFILLGGAAGDRFGRRRIFVIGNAVFGLASLACGIAPNIEALIVARFFQGIGGALLTPGSLALISANFDEASRGKAIGTWSGVAAMAAAVGPVLGGWLAETFGWRWVFFLNLPLIVAVIAISQLCVPESRDTHETGKIDVAGAALATAGLGAMTYGLIRGQGIPDSEGITAVVAGLAILVAFLWREHSAPNPMLPLEVFKNRVFSGANVYTFFLYAALGGALYFVPFDLQNVQGYTPAAAGAVYLPFVVIMFVFSRWSGGLVAHVGARGPLLAGALFAAVGFALFGFSGLDRPYWSAFFAPAFVLGIGGALFVAPLTTVVMECLGQDRAGTASGINNAVSRVAGLIAIAVVGIVLLGTFYRDLDRRVEAAGFSAETRSALVETRRLLPQIVVPAAVAPNERAKVRLVLREAYTDGFRTAMLTAVAMCILAAFVAVFTIERPPPRAG